MPFPQALVIRFFQLLVNRELTEAEHELDLIKLEVHSLISEHEFEDIRQLLSKGQYAEGAQEVNKLKEVLANKRLSITQREFDSFKRQLGRQPTGIQQGLAIIANLLAEKHFLEVEEETVKLEKLITAKDPLESASVFKHFKRILFHKQFTEAAADLEMLQRLITKKEFAKADSELEKFKHRKRRTEWDRGYYRALYGMYLSRKSSSDIYALFSKLDFSDKAALHAYRREFLEHTNNGLHGEFDKGYFSAWAECMRILIRMDIPSPQVSSNDNAADGEKLETLKSDKSQATIANFFKNDTK